MALGAAAVFVGKDVEEVIARVGVLVQVVAPLVRCTQVGACPGEGELRASSIHADVALLVRKELELVDTALGR